MAWLGVGAWAGPLSGQLSSVAKSEAHRLLDDRGPSGRLTPGPGRGTDLPSSFPHTSREPVLLAHGTGSNAAESYNWGVVQGLTSQGYDVCTVDLPGYALGDIQDSTEYVVYAIDTIFAASGRKVDAIGHSQGNMEIRWAVKWWPDLQNKVDDVVLLGNPGHGVVGGNLVCVLPCIPAATQFSIVGSQFLSAFNNGDETPGPISYTSIYSYSDLAIVPITTAKLNGAKNIAPQDICWGRVVTHGGLLYEADLPPRRRRARQPGDRDPESPSAGQVPRGLRPRLFGR